jgi:hypothetical protein
MASWKRVAAYFDCEQDHGLHGRENHPEEGLSSNQLRNRLATAQPRAYRAQGIFL